MIRVHLNFSPLKFTPVTHSARYKNYQTFAGRPRVVRVGPEANER